MTKKIKILLEYVSCVPAVNKLNDEDYNKQAEELNKKLGGKDEQQRVQRIQR